MSLPIEEMLEVINTYSEDNGYEKVIRDIHKEGTELNSELSDYHRFAATKQELKLFHALTHEILAECKKQNCRYFLEVYHEMNDTSEDDYYEAIHESELQSLIYDRI